MNSQIPPLFADPISRSIWNALHGPEGPMSKLNDQVDKIKGEAKSVSDLNQTVIELNNTLKDTNSILREFLNKI